MAAKGWEGKGGVRPIGDEPAGKEEEKKINGDGETDSGDEVGMIIA